MNYLAIIICKKLCFLVNLFKIYEQINICTDKFNSRLVVMTFSSLCPVVAKRSATHFLYTSNRDFKYIVGLEHGVKNLRSGSFNRSFAC